MYSEPKFEVSKLSVKVLAIGNEGNIYFICMENHTVKYCPAIANVWTCSTQNNSGMAFNICMSQRK